MSRENVEGVLRGYEALNRGDLEAAVEGVAPECELALPPMLPEADTHQGRDGLRRIWETWRESFEEFRLEVEEAIDAGDRVVVMAAVRGTGKDSGADVSTPTFPISGPCGTTRSSAWRRCPPGRGPGGRGLAE